MSGIDGLLALIVINRRQAALNHPARGLDGTRGDDAFGGAPGAQQNVYVGVVTSGRNATGNVPVHNELHPGPGFANFAHQAFVSRPVEHAHIEL